MSTFLRDMPFFVEVAKQKSFSKAAENLDMYTSTLSRRIAALEKDMGVPLFLRNTRNVELTESGKVLMERCEFILAETEHAREAVVGNMTGLEGPVRVSMFEYSYYGAMRGVFSRFAVQWPGIQLRIHFNKNPVDLMVEPYDIDFRNGPLADSSLKARKALYIEPCLYASPKFLESYPAPKKPEDLRGIPCICLDRAGMGTVWPMEKGKQRINVPVCAAHIFGSVALCHEFALAGLGVAMLRNHLANEDVRNGRLVRVLPDWTGPRHDMYMVMAPGQTPRRVRVLVDYLADFFSTVPL